MTDIANLFEQNIVFNPEASELESIIMSIRILDDPIGLSNFVDMIVWFETYDSVDIHFNKFMQAIDTEFKSIYGISMTSGNLAMYAQKDMVLLNQLFTRALEDQTSDMFNYGSGLSCSLKSKYKYWICANRKIIWNKVVYDIMDFNQGYQYQIDPTLYNEYALLEYFVYSYEITGSIHFNNQDYAISFNPDLTVIRPD